MKKKNVLLGVIVAASMTLTYGSVRADTNPTETQPAADNTRVNGENGRAVQPTADQAKNTLSDRELMSEIRKAVVSDKSLTTYGHNVKIIAKNGKVDLQGTVHTEEEKNNIGQKASNIAGRENVTNSLMVKGS